MWDVVGIAIANNLKPENQYAAMGVTLLAALITRSPSVAKAEVGITKAELAIVKAESKAIVNLTEETFSQALMKGAENVGGYSIYGY